MKMLSQQSCDTCKWEDESWMGEHCDSCCKAHSNYEPKEEMMRNELHLLRGEDKGRRNRY